MSEQSERTQSPASLKAYQQDLERAAMLHPLSAACLQLWDTLLCEVVDETVSAYAQAHAARPTPLPPASQELLEGWTPEQTRAAAASSAVRDVLELEASALSARKPSQAATAQLEDVFGNRPKQGADTIVCTNCKSEVSSNRCARMPKATDPRYPEAPATSPSGLDTPRQRHESQRRAASRLGQPRPPGWWVPAGRPQYCTALAFDLVGSRRTSSDACWVKVAPRRGPHETACGPPLRSDSRLGMGIYSVRYINKGCRVRQLTFIGASENEISGTEDGTHHNMAAVILTWLPERGSRRFASAHIPYVYLLSTTPYYLLTLLLTYLLTYVRDFPDHLITYLRTYLLDTIRQGGPTRTSADVSVPRLAGFSLIT